MAVTASELVVKVGWDDSEVNKGAANTESKISTTKVAIGSMIGQLGAELASSLPGTIWNAMTTIEDALAPVGTLLGRHSDAFASYTDNIKELMKSSPKSADELGRAAYDLVSAGISDTDVAYKALIDSNKLAVAGLGSVPQAVDVVTSAMNSFKSENLDSQRAAETFFGTIQLGKTDLAGIAQGFGGVAPLASEAGVTFKELMASVASITATGTGASEVYTSMKATLSNVIKPTAEAQKVSEALGLEFNATALKAKGFSGFLNDVKQATGGNVEVMAKLFGSTEAVNFVMALTGSQAGSFANALGTVETAGASMTERAEEMNETLSARFEIAKNKFMGITAELANKGLNVLIDLWKVYGDDVKKIFDFIGNAWTTFVGAFKSGDSEISSSGFPGFMQEAGIAARAFVNFIIENWPKVRELIATVFEWFQTYVVPVWVAKMEVLRNGFNLIVSWIKENWPTIQPIFETAGEVISEVFGLIGDVATLVYEQFKTVFDGISSVMNEHGTEIKAVLTAVWNFIGPLIKGSLDAVLALVKTFRALLKGDWEGAWKNVQELFSSLWETTKALIWGAFQRLEDLGQEIARIAVSLMTSLVQGMVRVALELPGRLSSLVLDGFRAAGRVDTWSIGWDLITGMVRGVHAAAWKLVDAVGGAVGDAIGKAKSLLGIGSPSRVFHDFGAMTVVGYSQGVDQERTRLDRMMRGTFNPGNFYSQSVSSSSNIGTVNINMPQGSSGDDVVRALRQYQQVNGAIPITVRGF